MPRCPNNSVSRAFLCLALLGLVVLAIGCDELSGSLSTGRCWSEGFGFTEITDDVGDQYPVHPVPVFQDSESQTQVCGVERNSGASPVTLPIKRVFVLVKSDQGFYLPSGEPIYTLDPETHHRFWILTPAQWFDE